MKLKCAYCDEMTKTIAVTIHSKRVWADPVCEKHVPICHVCGGRSEALLVYETGNFLAHVCYGCYEQSITGQHRNYNEFQWAVHKAVWMRTRLRHGDLTPHLIDGVKLWWFVMGKGEYPDETYSPCEVCGEKGGQMIAIAGPHHASVEYACKKHMPVCPMCKKETKDLFALSHCGDLVCEECMEHKLEGLSRGIFYIDEKWDRMKKMHEKYFQGIIPAYGNGIRNWRSLKEKTDAQ